MDNTKTKKLLLFIAMIISSVFLFSCNSTPKNIQEPQWFLNKKQAFPESEYVAQIGTGDSPLEAKNNSISQLASYFNTSVKSVVQGDSLIINTEQNESSVQKSITSSVVTTTDLDLFALETVEPFYYKLEKKWYCCAYINRKTAWEQYEPVIRDQKQKFYNLYNYAMAQTQPLNRIKSLSQAQETGYDFLACLDKAYIISKDITDSAYAGDKALIASIPGLIQSEKNKCFVYIKVDGDFANSISSKMTNVFSNMDFVVTQNAENSLYIIETAIDLNKINEDDLLILYPSITIDVKNEGKSIYSYEAKIDKILSYNESKAQKIASDSIEQKIENEFIQDFIKSMGLDK